MSAADPYSQFLAAKVCTAAQLGFDVDPITSACAWCPTPEQLDQLRALLPAPALSRALVQAAPHQVEACGAYSEVQP